MSNKTISEIVEYMANCIGESKDERRDDVSHIFEEMKQAITQAMLDALPEISKQRSDGKSRSFSTKATWDYAETYIQGERNYQSKVKLAIKKIGGRDEKG